MALRISEVRYQPGGPYRRIHSFPIKASAGATQEWNVARALGSDLVPSLGRGFPSDLIHRSVEVYLPTDNLMARP